MRGGVLYWGVGLLQLVHLGNLWMDLQECVFVFGAHCVCGRVCVFVCVLLYMCGHPDHVMRPRCPPRGHTRARLTQCCIWTHGAAYMHVVGLVGKGQPRISHELSENSLHH